MSTNQSMQIFSIISQIEQVVENSPRPKLGGNTKRTVDVDEIYDLLGDLKVTIPEDIRRANSVLIDADNIVAHAEEQARDMAEEAERRFEQRLSEHEITAEAERRAAALTHMAETNANIVYEGAKQYADDILADLQRFLVKYQDLVAENRAELGVRAREEAQEASAEQSAPQEEARRVPHRKAPAQNVAEDDGDFDDEEDFAPRKSILSGLFKRKRRSDDFDDMEEEELYEEDAPEQEQSARRFKKAETPELDMDLPEE